VATTIRVVLTGHAKTRLAVPRRLVSATTGKSESSLIHPHTSGVFFCFFFSLFFLISGVFFYLFLTLAQLSLSLSGPAALQEFLPMRYAGSTATLNRSEVRTPRLRVRSGLSMSDVANGLSVE
jgi:hypothetical protein